MRRTDRTKQSRHLTGASDHGLSRVSVSFDETNLVPNAGLLPAEVLAERLDVAGLGDRRLHLARHGANSGAKALSVIGSMLAGGDSIDDVAVLPRRRRSVVVRRDAGAVDGRGCGRTSGPTSASSTRSAASCWPGWGRPAPDRGAWPGR